MILEPKCGYFNEERNDEYAPPEKMMINYRGNYEKAI